MDPSAQKIVVVDLRIPFFRLVFFFVKLSLAAIPAAVILAVIGFALSTIAAGLFGAQLDVMMRRWTM